MLADVAENIFNRKLLNKFWHLAPKEVKELSDIVYKKIEIPCFKKKKYEQVSQGLKHFN